MNKIITYSRHVPVWRKIIGIILILIGIIELAFLNFLGLVPLTFAFLLLRTEGSEINLESKTYRITNSILGLKIGKWMALPEIEYVSVFATTENITVRALSAETTNSFPIVIINLFYDTNKKIEVYKSNDKQDAFNTALHFADALEIDMLDATITGDFKWMDKDAYREKGEFVYSD